jgi:hypothetical protein
LSLLTALSAVLWKSDGSVGLAGSAAMPPLTRSSDAWSLAALAFAVAQSAASAAAAAALSVLLGSAVAAAWLAAALSHAVFATAFARSTLACVVLANPAGSSAVPLAAFGVCPNALGAAPSRIAALSSRPTLFITTPSVGPENTLWSES